MDNQGYISLYRLIKEIAEEEGLEFSKFDELERGDKKSKLEEEFRNYKKGKSDYFKEILHTNGLNHEAKYKVGEEYQIHIEEKEAIKFMIRQFTSKYYRKVRKGIEPKLEDTKEIVNNAEKYISERYKGAEAIKQLKSIYRVTGLQTKLRREGIYDESLKMIKNSINRILVDEENIDLKRILQTNIELSKFNDIKLLKFQESEKVLDYLYKKNNNTEDLKIRFLSEDDCILLENIYREMISLLDRDWNRIADLVAELRNIETDEEEIIVPKRSAQILYEATELLISEKKKSCTHIKKESIAVVEEGIDQIMLKIKNELENKK